MSRGKTGISGFIYVRKAEKGFSVNAAIVLLAKNDRRIGLKKELRSNVMSKAKPYEWLSPPRENDIQGTTVRSTAVLFFRLRHRLVPSREAKK